jgi:hypothetical protein
MAIVTFWFEECPRKIPKSYELGVGGLGFAKCYINDIIALNLIPWDHIQHL